MNIQHLFAISSALLLLGCSSSSKSTNPTNSSSGASSSGSKSSSSIAAKPSNMRAATLSDIPRIAQFPSQAGYTVMYVFGASGVYSKLFLTSDGSTALQAAGTYQLDTSGTMTLTNQDCLGTSARRDSLCQAPYLDAKMMFYVKSDTLPADTLLETADNVTMNAIHVGTLVANPVRIAKAADVVGVWSVGNDTNGYTFEFYPDYRYVRHSFSNDSESIETGLFDVQKDQLLTLTDKCVGSCYTVGFFAAVHASNQLLLTSSTGATATDSLSYVGVVDTTSFTASMLLGTWKGSLLDANKAATHTFQLSFLSTGIVDISAFDASSGSLAYSDDGAYSNIGPWLILDFNQGSVTCTGNGTLGALVNGKMSCYGLIINKAVVTGGDSLSFPNAFIPTQWGLQ